MSPETSRVLERALGRGAGQRAGIHFVLGAFLLAPLLFVAANLAKAETLGPLRKGELALLSFFGALAVAGAVLIVRALKSTGARGTRVGRTVLDDPERVFSVKAFQRDIRANGVKLRTVHVVSIAIDQGDELELHLQPSEVPEVLAALKQTVGPHAMSA